MPLGQSEEPHLRPERKPEWLKVRAPGGEAYGRIQQLRKGLKLATVCEEARCPNIGECWNSGTATFMLLGDVCTRGCRFCNVKTGRPGGLVDEAEPFHVATAVRTMELSYVVLTMVDRDDLEDGGAGHVARSVQEIVASSPGIKVEVLTGDFRGRMDSLRVVAMSPAHVLAHNVETVRALTPRVRDRKSSYTQSLAALAAYKSIAAEKLTKASIMLGLGETEEQVLETLRDLRSASVDIVTIGQYLQPSPRHLPVAAYIRPEVFDRWRAMATDLGFLFCASGPLVRSSYKAGELFTERYLRDRDLSQSGEVFAKG